MRTPDVQHIAITLADDTVAVMAFVTAEYGPDGEGGRVAHWQREATQDEVEMEIAKTSFDADKLPVKRWALIDTASVPDDRTYRAAWRHTDKDGFHHDMPHARDLHRARLREARAYLLADLDTAYMRADEAGDAKAKKEIAARKQELRDVTSHPDIAKAKTVEQLKKAAAAVVVL